MSINIAQDFYSFDPGSCMFDPRFNPVPICRSIERDVEPVNIIGNIAIDDFDDYILYTHISSNLSDRVEMLCEIFDGIRYEDETKSFLFRNDDLIDLIHEANLRISQYFPKDTKKIISYSCSPYDDGEEEINILLSSASEASLFDYFDAFDDSWWLSKAPNVNGRLVFRV